MHARIYIYFSIQICYNVPKVNPSKTTVTVGYPVPEKKCENKQVKLPKVKCDEVSVSLKTESFYFEISFLSGEELFPASLHN